MIEIDIIDFIDEHYDIGVISVVNLQDGVSSTYLIQGKEEKYLLKFIPESFKSTAIESLEVLMYLEKHNFPSPRVVPTKLGYPYLYNDKSLTTLYTYTEGKELDDHEDFKKIGATIARLHQLMENYKGPLKEKGKEFFVNRYINILGEKRYCNSKTAEFKEYGDYLWERVKDLPKGYCHGDLHRGNLIKNSEGDYHLLDFDTSCNAFPIYDVMILCNSTDYFTYREDLFELTKIRYEKFLEGYKEYRTLDKCEIDAFYDLIGIYHYQLQATIIEIYGLDCVDDAFIDNQLDWLMKWKKQCKMRL